MARRYDPVDEDKPGSLATLTPQSSPSLFELTAASSPPDSRQLKVDAVRELPKPGQHRGKFLVGALASIVSLVAVLALLALCRSSQKKLNSGGAAQRNLSDMEDEENISSIIEQCLDLEEELGLRPAASPPTDEAGEGKAKLLAMLYESSATFEQMRVIASQKREGDLHPPPPKIPRLTESWASDPHSQRPAGAFLSHPSGMAVGGAASALDADAWVEEESGLVSVEAVDKSYTTNQEGKPGETRISPPSSFAFGEGHSGDDATTPEAWLDDSSANTDEQDLQQTVVSTVARHPTVETSSVASTSARDIREHPFVRLPVVNPEDIPRHFSELGSLPCDMLLDSPMDAYMTMRSLFAKPSLTAEDVDTLMVKADILVKYATHKLARPDRRFKACTLFMKLSSLFMIFDQLVCTIELLGDKMDTDRWWPAFVQQFQTDYIFPEHVPSPKSRMLNRLVNRLSSALEIYKEGRRPPLEEVIDLKRAIITHAYKDSQLANPLWKVWIQDDHEFFSS
ncbi:uncharacterized protein EMH_0070410 [Eimeria mitis]|uniref:Uncharacterized protein n=1 Tax=Eimeria mitis TaxID=44415 RepID=U6K2H5_9EIME|nr:uncharacterized protein EMH_0070410 [Eimeria mitis]CDJ31859.1 hypothetical protein, conserved [Eimeria mitis]